MTPDRSIPVHAWAEVPAFECEADEAAWWGSHHVSDQLAATFGPLDDVLPDPRAVMEPWTPQIGQHVRVLARPECFYCREDADTETGETGVITALKSPPGPSTEPGEAAHRVWVTFDDPTVAERTTHGCWVSHFAVVELELLNDVLPPAREEEP